MHEFKITAEYRKMKVQLKVCPFMKPINTNVTSRKIPEHSVPLSMTEFLLDK